MKRVQNEIILVVVYVDDLLIAGPNIGLINDFKSDLKGAFHMSDLGELNYFLGLQISRLHDGLLSLKKNIFWIISKKLTCLNVSQPLLLFNLELSLLKNVFSKRLMLLYIDNLLVAWFI